MNHLDIAPQFSSFVRAISSTIGTIPGIVAPLVAGLIVTIPTASPIESEGDTPNNKETEIEFVNHWKYVFIITAHIYFFGCIFYWFYSSGEVQPWAKLPADAQGVNDTADIESNSATITEDVERPTRKKNKNSNAKRRANRDSSNQPTVHENTSKNRHKSPAKDKNKGKSKNSKTSESLTIGARFLKMYDQFANYLSRIFKF